MTIDFPYLDQSSKILIGASFQFDILQKPGGSISSIKNAQVKIYDSNGTLVWRKGSSIS